MSSSFADALFWASVALCAVAQLALLHSFFFGASRPGRDSAASFRATETMWAIVPAAVLVVLLVATWQRIQAPPSFRFEMVPAGAAAQAPVLAPAAAPILAPAAPAAGGAS